MGIEYRKRCLEYALQQCREDAIVNMTDDEILAEWGLQRTQGDGWQDIATAPKTDPVNMRALPFLGWCPDKTAPLGGDIRVIWWEPVMQRADETSPRARWYGDRDMEERPTHWRPLPEPPAPPAAELERAPKQDGLAELRALSEKATPGEWKPVSFYKSTQLQADNFIVAGRIGVIDGSNNQNDAAFIVACVNHVRAEIERRGG